MPEAPRPRKSRCKIPLFTKNCCFLLPLEVRKIECFRPMKAGKIPRGKSELSPPRGIFPGFLLPGQKSYGCSKRQRETACFSRQASSAIAGPGGIIPLVGCGAMPRQPSPNYSASAFASRSKSRPFTFPSRFTSAKARSRVTPWPARYRARRSRSLPSTLPSPFTSPGSS